MKHFLIVSLIFIYLVQINAQNISKSENYSPPWKNGDMPSIDKNKFYLKVCRGEGSSLGEAIQNSIARLISDIAVSKGITVTGEEINELKNREINGKFDVEKSYKSNYKIQTHGFNVSFEMIDDYFEEESSYNSKRYVCWGLFEIAYDSNTTRFDKITYTTNYGFAAVLKSAIVPGWGQFSKMQKVKGLSIFGGEVALLGFGLVAENMRVDLITKMNNSRDVAFKKQCLDLANSWENGRNISFATAGALYVYNLIDAVVSKGAKRYIYNKNVSLIPQYDQNSVGITLVCNLK